MTEQKHAPGPWMARSFVGRSDRSYITDAKDFTVAYLEGDNQAEKAAYIVRCVNAHEELVALVSQATSFLENIEIDGHDPRARTQQPLLLRRLKAALERAKGAR